MTKRPAPRKGTQFYMHRELAKPTNGLVTDHRNRDTLDNRRENLRAVSRSANSHNTDMPKGKGIHWNERDRLWVARIGVERKTVYLGSCKSREVAMSAYQTARQEVQARA